MSVLETLSWGGSPTPVADADPQTIADVLSSDRRCLVIEHLDALAPIAFGELVDEIAAIEHGARFSHAERKRIYTSLYQTHLERLAEVGVLEYDGQLSVRLGCEYAAYAAALDALRAHSGGGAQ